VSPDNVLRDALRKSFEDSLKAPPSQRLDDLMRELRKQEKSRRGADDDSSS